MGIENPEISIGIAWVHALLNPHGDRERVSICVGQRLRSALLNPHGDREPDFIDNEVLDSDLLNPHGDRERGSED